MDVEFARQQMIDQQVRAWEVLDPAVLRVMGEVPREQFVPEAYRGLAFADVNVPLPCDQVMMTPSVEGRMLQALAIRPGDSVLDIGTGSGFSAACLAGLGGKVTSLEIHEELTAQAEHVCNRLALRSIRFETRDAARLEAGSRYDAIAVTGSVPVLDDSYRQALAVGGRLFVIVGDEPVMQALLITRTGEGEWLSESLFETVLPPLENVRRPVSFEF